MGWFLTLTFRFDEEGDDVGDMGAFKHNFCSLSSTISW